MACTLPKCAICGAEGHFLRDHLREAHGLSVAEYQTQHPGAPVISKALHALFQKKSSVKRRAVEGMDLRFAGIKTPVNTGVPASACLPMPLHYRIPEHGPLAAKVRSVSLALKKGRSCYVWGAAGTGKDAIFHAWSHLSRTPGLIFTIRPGADIEGWFFQRGFTEKGTFDEEGLLLKALRDGYTAPDGSRHPYLILISDFDRADRAQAESLRLIADSIKGRIMGPGGKTYDVLPGTRIVLTSNTAGSGDVSGRYVSANPIDASILNRIEQTFHFPFLDWRDEVKIIERKFPRLMASLGGQEKDRLGVACGEIRNKVALGEFEEFEFSHRTLCAWCAAAQDIIEEFEDEGLKPPKGVLIEAAATWLDRIAEEELRVVASKILDPNIKGNALGAALKQLVK